MATVLETCASMADADCGAYVKTTCALDPGSCGIYDTFLSYGVSMDMVQFAALAFLTAYVFRVAKKAAWYNA